VQQSRQGGYHGTVGPVRLRECDLPPQDGDLMPEDQDLRVLHGVIPGQQHQPSTRTMNR